MSVRRYVPGALVYGGGAVHEVLEDGSLREREDLTPGSPKRLWKPRWTSDRPRWSRPKERWIQGALKRHKRGALHRQLGIPPRQRIPIAVLRRAAKAKGLLGRRARLALTLRRISRERQVRRARGG